MVAGGVELEAHVVGSVGPARVAIVVTAGSGGGSVGIRRGDCRGRERHGVESARRTLTGAGDPEAANAGLVVAADTGQRQ